MPYRRRSVWIDVFGVLLFGAVLLGGAGYLLFQMGGAIGSSGGGGPAIGGEPAISSRGASPAPRAEPGLQGHRSAPASRSPSLFGDGASSIGGTGAEVPFSDNWRSRAAPDLTGPSGSSGAWSEDGAIGGGPPESEGPTIASQRSQSGTESRSARARTGGGEAAWQSEARNLAGRARALSNEIAGLDRSDSQAGSGETDTRDNAPEQAATASASSNDRDPGDPPSVPIGDHLHWLVVAGILWGAWRIGRGG